MTRSLMTGITGLRTHQQQLDVVANNLANMNSIGFKAQTALFSDLMYTNFRQASEASTNNGGVNPQSIGAGAQVAQLNRRFSQGTLQSTGEALDFAIQGDGFFTLRDASGETLYTRDGSFGIDSSGRLVDPATGSRVQRFGSVGEETDDNLGFQIANDTSIYVPIGFGVAGDRTSNLSFIGNLPSTADQPRAEELNSQIPFESATGPANSATLLNDLTINTTPYQAGDVIELSGTNPDGTAFSTTIPADTSTMGDLVTALNSTMTDATASIATDGTLQVTADNTGDAALTLVLRDSDTNVGGSNFSSGTLFTVTPGSSGATHQLSVEVYDSTGASHRLNFTFQKTSGDTWDMIAELDSESGVLLDDRVSDITFNDDGSLAVIAGSSTGDADIEIQFNDITAPQTISLDLSQLQHLATDFAMTQQQDGFPPGTISSLAVSAEGMLTALATNGKTIPLAQLAIAGFRNNRALDSVGGNYYRQSLNSGEPSMGEGAANGRGVVVGGQLESSNVDIAQEFTQLIVAQRGFSANARTITVADEMLEELTNIIR